MHCLGSMGQGASKTVVQQAHSDQHEGREDEEREQQAADRPAGLQQRLKESVKQLKAASDRLMQQETSEVVECQQSHRPVEMTDLADDYCKHNCHQAGGHAVAMQKMPLITCPWCGHRRDRPVVRRRSSLDLLSEALGVLQTSVEVMLQEDQAPTELASQSKAKIDKARRNLHTIPERFHKEVVELLDRSERQFDEYKSFRSRAGVALRNVGKLITNIQDRLHTNGDMLECGSESYNRRTYSLFETVHELMQRIHSQAEVVKDQFSKLKSDASLLQAKLKKVLWFRVGMAVLTGLLAVGSLACVILTLPFIPVLGFFMFAVWKVTGHCLATFGFVALSAGFAQTSVEYPEFIDHEVFDTWQECARAFAELVGNAAETFQQLADGAQGDPIRLKDRQGMLDTARDDVIKAAERPLP